MENTDQVTKPDEEQTKDTMVEKYWHYLLTKGTRPNSVYAFTEEIGVEESDFYTHASSFEALESQYWLSLTEDTIKILRNDEDYANYSPEQKILAFFYTFFLHVQKNRSRLVSYFPKIGTLSGLKPMRQSFIHFAKEIITQGVEDGSIADRKQLTEKYPHLLFEQLRGIIEFHKNDQSPEFQDTDALIEKSVRLSADIASAGTLDSAFDLGRFLLRKFTLADQ